VDYSTRGPAKRRMEGKGTVDEDRLRLVELDKEWTSVPRACARAEDTDHEARRRLEHTAAARRKVFAYLESRRQEAVEFLQALVRIPSVNPSQAAEAPLADYLAEQMESIGMQVRQMEPAPNRKSNLGCLEACPGGATLLFDSHLDVVPAGDPGSWQRDPFGAQVVDGRLYGRGSKDMKSGMAAAFQAIEAIIRTGADLKGNIAFATTADEERGGHWGLHQMVERGWLKGIDWAVYTEGVLDQITTGARGLVQFDVTVSGRTSHTSRKGEGVNAIVRAAEIIPSIDAMRFGDWREHSIVPGSPIASVNMIRGGFKENVVPDTCTFSVDLRFPPGPDPAGVLREVDGVLEEARYRNPYLGGICTSRRVRTVARPYAQSPDEPIVRYLREAAHVVLGRRPEPRGMYATSDARWLVLDAGIPTVNYAAGNGTGHQPNEYIDLNEYLDTIKIYAALALLLLG